MLGIFPLFLCFFDTQYTLVPLLSPEYITGFVDGDGCFSIIEAPSSKNQERFAFVISQNKRSEEVLHKFKEYFGCGYVHKTSADMMEFRVGNQKDLVEKILPFFEKYPLQSSKKANLAKFSNKLLENYNLQEKYYFDYDKYNQDLYKHPDWLAGLFDADGCFYGSVTGGRLRPQALLVLKIEDKQLLVKLQNNYQIGQTYARGQDPDELTKEKSIKKLAKYFVFQVSKFEELQILINYLYINDSESRLQTTKKQSLAYFRQILSLWKEDVSIRRELPKEKRDKIKAQYLEKINHYREVMNKFK